MSLKRVFQHGPWWFCGTGPGLSGSPRLWPELCASSSGPPPSGTHPLSSVECGTVIILNFITWLFLIYFSFIFSIFNLQTLLHLWWQLIANQKIKSYIPTYFYICRAFYFWISGSYKVMYKGELFAHATFELLKHSPPQVFEDLSRILLVILQCFPTFWNYN